MKFKELNNTYDPVKLHDSYLDLLKDLEIDVSKSYNLIVTPRLMWIVVRAKNSVASTDDPTAKVDINSLGFVGTLAVKNEQSMALLKSLGPLALLREVAANL